jgi:hypothetical protein
VARLEGFRTWVRRFGPAVITVAVIAALLRKYPFADIALQMRVGHTLRMLALPLLLPFVLWLPSAAYDWIVIRSAAERTTYRDIVRVKAATAMLLALGYAFSGGGYGVWIARVAKAGASRATGVVVYMMVSDLAAVSAVGGASMWLADLHVPHALRTVATIVLAAQVIAVVAGPLLPARAPALLAPWRDVPRLYALAQLAGRCTNIALIMFFAWTASRAFGLDVPLSAMAMVGPVILLVGALPISVAGFGAAQAAWLLLLPWASGPQILAFQFFWQLFLGASLIVRGLPFVRRILAETTV